MKNYRLYSRSILIVLTTFVFLLLSGIAQAQMGKIVATLDFDPAVDGFGFENYVNDHKWQDDLDAYDMMTMFGVSPVCVTGNSLSTCVVKKPAENWRLKILKEMKGGHCEGMAVTCFLFFEHREFKYKWKDPANFQKDVENVFDLKFPNQAIENYIAYFWATQAFPEVYKHRDATVKSGPLGIVKTLIDTMNEENGELWTIQICKYEDGDYKDCHAVAPFAVEDAGTYYNIHVYDNNNPGETRFIKVMKNAQQTWEYNAATNPNEEEDLYTGNKSTESFSIVPLSSRLYGTRYRAPFSTQKERNSESATSGSAGGGDTVEFFVSGDADMLVTAGDGKRIGYDWTKKQTVNEISGASMNYLSTFADDDTPPVINLPYQPSAKPFTVTLSGKSLKKESVNDLMYTGPGFSIGFDQIRLDPNENLTFQIAPDGTHLSFTSSADSETPVMYFTVNADNGASYQLEVGGVEVEAGKTLFVDLDLKAGKLHFRDNDGRHEKYDIEFERILPDGTEQKFETDDIDIGEADSYEMDFNNWDGKSPVCFRGDDEGDGFADEKCQAQPNEDDGVDMDEDLESVNRQPRFLQPLAWLIR
jgi:hypothetical protein